MPLVEFDIAPGLVTEETNRGAKGHWRDCNRVRFRQGLAEKLGGWESRDLDGDEITGIPRSMLDWRAIDSSALTAFGTHARLYQISGSTAANITPYRLATDAFSGSDLELSNPFTTTISSATVSVAHTSHGLAEGDTVYFDNASAVGGITIDGEYQVASITSTNAYTITHGSSASSSATGGGTVDYAYEITIGKTHGTSGLGYGVGPFGESTYGTARDESSLTLPARVWALDTFGEDLIANPRNGGIYLWDKSAGLASTNRAEVLSNAPAAAAWTIVSPADRHIIALGCTPSSGGDRDPLVIRWCSQNANTTWTATRTNTAGERRLDHASEILSGLRAHEEILIFTDLSLCAMRFVGPPSVFNIRRISGNCGLTGPLARAEYGGRAFWMSYEDFFMYDGSISAMPCPIRNHVFDDLNDSQRSAFFAGTNSLFQEVWFFYVSANGSEIDRYAIYSILDGTWAFGELERTCWTDISSVRSVPAAFQADATLYNHETGTSADGSAMGEFLESYDSEIPGAGDNLMFVRKLVPDFKTITGDMRVTLKARKYPDTQQAIRGPFAVASAGGYIRPRIRGRQVALRIESDQTNAGTHWRMGTWRADTRPHGRR